MYFSKNIYNNQTSTLNINVFVSLCVSNIFILYFEYNNLSFCSENTFNTTAASSLTPVWGAAVFNYNWCILTSEILKMTSYRIQSWLFGRLKWILTRQLRIPREEIEQF